MHYEIDEIKYKIGYTSQGINLESIDKLLQFVKTKDGATVVTEEDSLFTCENIESDFRLIHIVLNNSQRMEILAAITQILKEINTRIYWVNDIVDISFLIKCNHLSILSIKFSEIGLNIHNDAKL